MCFCVASCHRPHWLISGKVHPKDSTTKNVCTVRTKLIRKMIAPSTRTTLVLPSGMVSCFLFSFCWGVGMHEADFLCGRPSPASAWKQARRPRQPTRSASLSTTMSRRRSAQRSCRRRRHLVGPTRPTPHTSVQGCGRSGKKHVIAT